MAKLGLTLVTMSLEVWWRTVRKPQKPTILEPCIDEKRFQIHIPRVKIVLNLKSFIEKFVTKNNWQNKRRNRVYLSQLLKIRSEPTSSKSSTEWSWNASASMQWQCEHWPLLSCLQILCVQCCWPNLEQTAKRPVSVSEEH